MPDNNDTSLGVRLGVAGAAALLLLVPFALLTVLVAGNWAPLHELDRTVTDALHGFALGHPALVQAMVVWCYAFDPNSWRVAALALTIWLLRRGARPLAIWVVITMTVGGVLGPLLKLLVGRHRPDLLDPVARAAGLSFPSGHALDNSLGAWVFVLVLLPFVRDRPVRRVTLWVVATVIPVLTAACRVALGLHWTSDVVAGLLLGVAVVTAMATAYETWRGSSGHARVHIAEEGVELYGGLALILAMLVRRTWVKALCWALLLLPIAVALSRLYRGMHHPSDVTASFLTGALCLWIMARAGADDHLWPRRRTA